MTEEQKRVPMMELGVTGLQRQGGWIEEEFLPQLKGQRGIKVYREMSDNDPVIGSLLFVIDMLMRRITWRVEPESQSDREDAAAAEFIEECRNDMSSSWADLISEILSMLVYGWSFHEKVYKVRGGDVRDPQRRSKFNDGRIGWRKFPIRSQDSLWEWVFDEKGDGAVKGMVQQCWPKFTQVEIPLSKALLFRPRLYKDNPEGRSILRNAYRPWYFKKRIEEIEAIGIERDLAGIPVAEVPPELLDPNATAEERAILSQFKRIIRNVRRDNQEGIIIPLDYTDGGQSRYKFSLLSSGGIRQFDTGEVIQRYNEQIMMTALADFVLLGHHGYGSYALSADKTNMFELSLESWADMIASVFNVHEIPNLLSINSLRGKARLVPGRSDRVNLTELGLYVSYLAGAGALKIDGALETYLRAVAKMPPREGDEQNDEQGREEAETDYRVPNRLPRLSAQPRPSVDARRGSQSGRKGEMASEA